MKRIFSLFLLVFVFSLFKPYVYALDESNLESIPDNFYSESSEKGTLQEFNYDNRKCMIYLPFGYSSDTDYDIFYCMHGGYSASPNRYDQIFKTNNFSNVLDNMIEQKLIKPVIFVGLWWYPDSGPSVYADKSIYSLLYNVESNFSTYSKLDEYILDKDLDKEEIDKLLINSKSHRTFGGFSNGAYCTWMIMKNDNHNYFYGFVPCSAYGYDGFDYREVFNYINNNYKEDDFIIIDSIGSFENGNSGTPKWNLRKELYSEYEIFKEGKNYKQYLGLNRAHTVADCEHYIYQSLIDIYGISRENECKDEESLESGINNLYDKDLLSKEMFFNSKLLVFPKCRLPVRKFRFF